MLNVLCLCVCIVNVHAKRCDQLNLTLGGCWKEHGQRLHLVTLATPQRDVRSGCEACKRMDGSSNVKGHKMKSLQKRLQGVFVPSTCDLHYGRLLEATLQPIPGLGVPGELVAVYGGLFVSLLGVGSCSPCFLLHAPDALPFSHACAMVWWCWFPGWVGRLLPALPPAPSRCPPSLPCVCHGGVVLVSRAGWEVAARSSSCTLPMPPSCTRLRAKGTTDALRHLTLCESVLAVQ